MALLAPLLDGHNTLRDVTQPFPQQHRRFAEKLISMLVDLGVVQQSSADDPHTDDDPEVDLVGYSVAAPAAALAVLRAAPTVVIGVGPQAEAAAAALRDSDIETTCIDPAALDTVDFPACHAVACLAITDADRIAAVEQWCLRKDATLVLAALGQSSVWIAPPGVTFTAVRPRLDAVDSAAPQADYAAAPLAAVAAYLARTLIRCTTTIDDGSTGRRLARIDTETLETTTHRHLPLRRTPRPPDPESFLRRLATVRSTAALQDEDFARRAVEITDDRVGVISTVSEGPHAQLPLRVAETVVADPAGEISTAIRAFGVGKDTVSARLSAARAALRTYAALVAPRDGSVFGYSLDHHAPVAMSAVTAFGIAGAEAKYGPPVGTAYGDSLDDAVLAGLLDHCRSITLSTVRGRAGYGSRRSMLRYSSARSAVTVCRRWRRCVCRCSCSPSPRFSAHRWLPSSSTGSPWPMGAGSTSRMRSRTGSSPRPGADRRSIMTNRTTVLPRCPNSPPTYAELVAIRRRQPCGRRNWFGPCMPGAIRRRSCCSMMIRGSARSCLTWFASS